MQLSTCSVHNYVHHNTNSDLLLDLASLMDETKLKWGLSPRLFVTIAISAISTATKTIKIRFNIDFLLRSGSPWIIMRYWILISVWLSSLRKVTWSVRWRSTMTTSWRGAGWSWSSRTEGPGPARDPGPDLGLDPGPGEFTSHYQALLNQLSTNTFNINHQMGFFGHQTYFMSFI